MTKDFVIVLLLVSGLVSFLFYSSIFQMCSKDGFLFTLQLVITMHASLCIHFFCAGLAKTVLPCLLEGPVKRFRAFSMLLSHVCTIGLRGYDCLFSTAPSFVSKM